MVANFGKCRTAVFLASALAILATVSVCVGGGFGADLARMNVTTVGGGVPAAGGGGPDTYYYGVGSDNYPNTTSLSGGDIFGDDITVVSAGNITKISVKYGHNDVTPAAMKAGLYRNNAGTWTLVECITTTVPDNDNVQTWIDFTLTSPYAASAGEVVRVMLSINAGMVLSYSGTTNGMWITSNYATHCASTPTFETNDYQWAVRVYVD